MQKLWLQKIQQEIRKIGLAIARYATRFTAIGIIGRMQIMTRGIAVIFAILFFKILLILNSQNDKEKKTGIQVSTIAVSETLLRNDIIDRNGALLARNLTSSDLYLAPKRMFNITEDTEKLVNIFPDLENKIEDIRLKIERKKQTTLDSHKNPIILVKRGIFPLQKQRVLDEGITGVEFQNNQKRIYPHKNLASHILGFVSADGIGMAGIERSIDKKICQTCCGGSKIQLSIDINIQAIMRHTILTAMKKYQAKGAFGIIMNAKTGEIISAVSLPDFNPNNAKSLTDDKLFNRFSMGVYELGSVFKLFLAALAIQENISQTKEYNTSESYNLDKYKIKDFHFSQVRKTMNLLNIIRYSSNVGCARIMEEINPKKQQIMFDDIGFGSKLDIELPEKSETIMPKKWYKANSITASYGHGIAVTPMHFIAAASAIVNNGIFVIPTFIKISNSHQVRAIKRVVTPVVSKKVKDILREVVEYGSGRKSAAEKYDVGGKSGTAIQVKNGKYNYQKMVISFFAAVPISNPEYVFYVGLEEPLATRKTEKLITGGSVVAPIVSDIISISGPMLGISMKK